MEMVSFAAALVDAWGGVAVSDGRGEAHLLLPPALAAPTGLGDEVRVVDGGSEPRPATGDGVETVPLYHGSDALQRLLAAAIGEGRWSAVEVDRGRITAARARQTVERALHPVNGTIRIEETEAVDGLYLAVGFHYDAVGEERREGLVDVDLDFRGKLAAPGLSERLWSPGLPLREIEPPEDAVPTAVALAAAFSLARARTKEVLEPVYRMQCNRLARDGTRLHGYLSGMQRELLRVGAPRVRGEEGRAKLLQRTNALPEELDRRMAEARTRRSMRVALRPVTLVLVRMPATSVTVRLLRRKGERRITLTCGSVHRGVDLPVCEGCGERVLEAPMLCDERLHLLCSRCHWTCPGCGATVCLACRQRCPRCGEQHAQTGRRENPRGRVLQPEPARPEKTPRPARPAKRPPAPPAGVPRPARPAPRPPVPPAGVPEPQARAQLSLFDPAEQLRGRIVDLLRRSGVASTAEIARATGASPGQVRDAIQQLRRSGDVTHSGHGRGTRYHLA